MTPESIPDLLLGEEVHDLLRSDEYLAQPVHLDHEVVLTGLPKAA